jgi:hypothetical protein
VVALNDARKSVPSSPATPAFGLAYVHHSETLNPDLLVAKMEALLASLHLTANEGGAGGGSDSADHKPSVFIVVAAPSDTVGRRAEQATFLALSQAWTYLERPSLAGRRVISTGGIPALTSAIQPKFVPLRGLDSLSAVHREAIDKAIGEAVAGAGSGSGSSSIRTLTATLQPVLAKEISAAPKNTASVAVKAALQAALEATRDNANAELSNLQTSESPVEFAGFWRNLLAAAESEFEARLQGHAGRLGSGEKKTALMDLRRQAAVMIEPFFKRQVQLARRDVAKDFNEAVGDALQVRSFNL